MIRWWLILIALISFTKVTWAQTQVAQEDTTIEEPSDEIKEEVNELQDTSTPSTSTETTQPTPTPAPPEPVLDESEQTAETPAVIEETLKEDSTAENQQQKPPPEPPYPGSQTEAGFESQPAPTTSEVTRLQVTKPIEVDDEGAYMYGHDVTEKNYSFSMRGGYFTPPPKIINKKNKLPFESVYKGQTIPTALFDFEWQVVQSLGDLGLKFGTGVFAKSGTGQFADDSDRSAEKLGPQESFSFIMLPNTATLIYRFQYFDKQPLVPFVEGGGGYFTFVELRDDDKPPKYGAAGVGVGAAGVNFLLDWLDPHSIIQLDKDYGINHVWLTTEYRLIIGLNKAYDFSASIINAGVMMEF